MTGAPESVESVGIRRRKLITLCFAQRALSKVRRKFYVLDFLVWLFSKQRDLCRKTEHFSKHVFRFQRRRSCITAVLGRKRAFRRYREESCLGLLTH